MVSCVFLLKSSVSCQNLRPSAPFKCLNYQGKEWICENLRFSAKVCVLGSLCHLSFVPEARPEFWQFLGSVELGQINYIVMAHELPAALHVLPFFHLGTNNTSIATFHAGNLLGACWMSSRGHNTATNIVPTAREFMYHCCQTVCPLPWELSSYISRFKNI